MLDRLDTQTAHNFIKDLPPHRWYRRSLYDLLQKPVNAENVPKIPINERLLQSLKDNGFLSPFLVMDNWYPICGSQRLRAAVELSEEVQKSTFVDVMKLDNTVWANLYLWTNKEEGHKAAQIFIQTLEIVFKSAYMKHKTDGTTEMTVFEVEGDQLHWEGRDGPKK